MGLNIVIGVERLTNMLIDNSISMFKEEQITCHGNRDGVYGH